MVCQEPPEALNEKYEVLHPVQNNPIEISGVGTNWQGSSFAKKPLRVLVNQSGKHKSAVCPCGREGEGWLHTAVLPSVDSRLMEIIISLTTAFLTTL